MSIIFNTFHLNWLASWIPFSKDQRPWATWVASLPPLSRRSKFFDALAFPCFSLRNHLILPWVAFWKAAFSKKHVFTTCDKSQLFNSLTWHSLIVFFIEHNSVKHSALLSWNILKPRRALSRNWCNREGPNCLLLLYTIHFTNPICLGRRSLKVKMLKSYTTWMALDWPWILDFRTWLQLTAWFTQLVATTLGHIASISIKPRLLEYCNLTIRMIVNLLPLGP